MKIPAIKGKIGETIYYIANLTFQQINQLVKRVDSELHTSTSLKEEIQRSLSDNYLNLPQEMLYIHPYKKLYKTVSTRYFIIFVKHIDKQATYCFRLQILLLFDIV